MRQVCRRGRAAGLETQTADLVLQIDGARVEFGQPRRSISLHPIVQGLVVQGVEVGLEDRQPLRQRRVSIHAPLDPGRSAQQVDQGTRLRLLGDAKRFQQAGLIAPRQIQADQILKGGCLVLQERDAQVLARQSAALLLDLSDDRRQRCLGFGIAPLLPIEPAQALLHLQAQLGQRHHASPVLRLTQQRLGCLRVRHEQISQAHVGIGALHRPVLLADHSQRLPGQLDSRRAVALGVGQRCLLQHDSRAQMVVFGCRKQVGCPAQQVLRFS